MLVFTKNGKLTGYEEIWVNKRKNEERKEKEAFVNIFHAKWTNKRNAYSDAKQNKILTLKIIEPKVKVRSQICFQKKEKIHLTS